MQHKGLRNAENYQITVVTCFVNAMTTANIGMLLPFVALFHGLKWIPKLQQQSAREVPRCTTLVAEKAALQKADRLMLIFRV